MLDQTKSYLFEVIGADGHCKPVVVSPEKAVEYFEDSICNALSIKRNARTFAYRSTKAGVWASLGGQWADGLGYAFGSDGADKAAALQRLEAVALAVRELSDKRQG